MPPHGAKTRHAKPLSRQKERLDLSRIDEWDISLAFSDSKSVTSRLCIEVVRAFRSVLRRVKSRKDLPRSLSHRLDKSCGSLTLWAAGYGVREGELDDALAKSRSLRRSISELLLSIGKAVSEELIPRLGLGDDASVDVSSLRAATADASAALSEDRRRRNRASPGAKDDSSSSSSSSSSFSSGEEMYELDDATEDIANAVRCLLDLDSLIEAPAADQIQPEEHVNPSIEISCSPHQRFSERIAYRFPLAHGELVDRLARANLDRLQRTQMERRRNVLTKQEPEQSAVPSVVEVDQVSRTEGSTKFNDSGLGSSVRTASAYAETTMSYRQNESHSVRIPPLPAGAKLGVCFECMACNRTVSIRSNSAWKKHLYLDLKPWVCHDISCAYGDRPFPNRREWVNHLAQHHDFEVSSETINCPLCHEKMSEEKLKVIAHLAAHLEEISLAALPPMAESEEDSSHAEEESTDNDSVAEPPTKRSTVHKDSTLETWGESFGQAQDVTRRRSRDSAEKGDKSTPFDQEDESMVSRPDLPKTHHSRRFLRFVCRDPASVGIQTTVEPIVPLATCLDCRNGRKWRWFSGAVNHLHQFHFRQGVSKKGSKAQAHDADEGAQLKLALEDWIDTIDIREKARETLEAITSISKTQDRSTAEKLASEEFKSGDAFLPQAFGQEPPAAYGTGGSSTTDGYTGTEALNQRPRSSHEQQLERETPLIGASEGPRQAQAATGNPNFSCRLCVHRQGADGFKTRGELLRHIRASHSDDGNLLIEETRLLSQDLEQRRMFVPEVPPSLPTTDPINSQNHHPQQKEDSAELSVPYLGSLGAPPTKSEQVNVSNTVSVAGSITLPGPGEKVTKDHPVYRNATPGPDGLWHCPWEGQASCNHKGALYKVNYDKYVHFHVSAYQCDFSSCEMFGFSSLEELSRHERNVHTMFAFGENQFPCSYDGCERSLMGDGFPRQRDLQDHLRRVHGDNGSGSSRTANAPVKESQPRPWKCPETGCKYHEYGWATEKELDRHRNDRHSMAPPMYECYFKPCPYKSKRESNCKQHMEKAHGWEYVRTKNRGRRNSASIAEGSGPEQVERRVMHTAPELFSQEHAEMRPPLDESYSGDWGTLASLSPLPQGSPYDPQQACLPEQEDETLLSPSKTTVWHDSRPIAICAKEGCGIQTLKGPLCIYHKCFLPDCFAPVARQVGGYCQTHCCAIPTCPKGKIDNDHVNGLCLDHVREGLEEALGSAPSSEQHYSYVDESGKRKDEPHDFGAREAKTRLGEQRRPRRETHTGASDQLVPESPSPTTFLPDLPTTYSGGASMYSPLMGDTPQASGNRIARTMTDAPSDVATNTGLFGSYLSSDGLSDSDSFLSLDDDTRNLEPNDFLLFPRPTDAGDGPPPDDLPGAMSISPILNEGAAPPALPPPRHVPPVPSAPVIEPMQGSEEVDANEGAGITNDLGEAMGTPIGDDETPASARTGSSRPWQV
ncbi:hypothetical protein BN1723_002855 [Verticillium longisporum]|uniref:C2H2-type domain-containing protein n=2 Tax=Verticillium longisporum TaxID=100787 RepID=A0A0G4LL67_VERLO|nr:hypothetical protein BN1723_002855 [Verticillium longisporum]